MKKIGMVLIALLLVLPVFTVQTVEAGTHTWHVYPGQSIQNALDSASPRDTIIVHKGVYHQSVVIKKSIILVGDGAILDGTNADGGTVLSDAITIAGGVSGVTVKRFEIRDFGRFGIQASNDGTSNINIVANLIHDISNAAVNLAGTGAGLQENWLINGNTISNAAVGIAASQVRRLVISNNLLTNIWDSDSDRQ